MSPRPHVVSLSLCCFNIAVPEFDPTFADAARASAQLALKSAERLEGLLGRLNEAVPMLASCTLGHSLARHDPPRTALSQTNSSMHKSIAKSSVHDGSAAAAASRSMIEQLKVGALADLITRARATLADVRRQL